VIFFLLLRYKTQKRREENQAHALHPGQVQTPTSPMLKSAHLPPQSTSSLGPIPIGELDPNAYRAFLASANAAVSDQFLDPVSGRPVANVPEDSQPYLQANPQGGRFYG
jgi:hypothetical protein